MEARLAAGEYDGLDEESLAERLTAQLSEACADKHLRVRMMPPLAVRREPAGPADRQEPGGPGPAPRPGPGPGPGHGPRLGHGPGRRDPWGPGHFGPPLVQP